MKILYVLHSTNPDGSIQSFLTMVKGIAEHGVSIMIVGPTPRIDFLEKIKDIDVEYQSIHIAENVYPFKDRIPLIVYYLKILNLLRRRCRSFRELYAIAKQYNPDIIHTNCGTIKEGFRVAQKLKKPHVWHIREHQGNDTLWVPFPTKKKLEHSFKKSNIIAITNSLLQYYGLSQNFLNRVIYNGILPKSAKFYKWPKEKFFLISSRISEEKCIIDIIETFAEFSHSRNDFKLIILGNGDSAYVEELKNRVEELGCENNVVWEGYVSNVLPYMQRASALVVASKNEGFGRMTAEALINGCTVIGRNNTGTKEILDYAGGLLFNTNAEMLEHMHLVASLSENQYKTLVQPAQKKALDAYCIENHVDQVFKFYNDILA